LVHKLPTNEQNLTEIDLAKMKLSYRVLGGFLFSNKTPEVD